MAAAAQKIVALNKVYADIILHTAKESTARVLAAERRALGFQQQASAAKEEVIDTLLRLNTVMDSKASQPQLNFKSKYSESYRSSHPNAPVVVPWISGVVST